MLKWLYRIFLLGILAGSCGLFLYNALAQTPDQPPDSFTIETNIQGTLVFSAFRKPHGHTMRLWVIKDQNLYELGLNGVQPIISRDSKTLVFQSNGELQRFSFKLRKGEILPISKITTLFDYDVSPDGKEICFVTSEISQSKGLYGCNLHIGNLNGTNIRCLTQFSPTDTVGGVNNPKWSPAGDSILFTAFDPTETKGKRNVRLWVIKKDGTGLRKIHNEISNYSVNEPAWSPDGKKVAFVERPSNPQQEGYDYEVYVCDADGSNVKRLTNNDWNEREPVFSPDGKQICFVSYRHQKVGMAGFGSELYLINADGTNEQRLTPPEKVPGALGGWAEDHSPTWGPSSD